MDKPVIITSELLPSDMIKIDEGIVSRLMEMSQKYTLISTDKNKRLEHWRKKK